MSYFAVQVLKVESLRPVPNTDKLLIMKFVGNGYQCIVNKDTGYRKGDAVLFFPPDALIPATLINKLDIADYLAIGNDRDSNGKLFKQRVKSIKLKGQVSEGLVLSVDAVFTRYSQDVCDKLYELMQTQDFGGMTELMGVKKYKSSDEQKSERTAMFDTSLYPIRNIGVQPYDVERWQNYLDWLEDMKLMRVFITEKLHGDNGGIKYSSKDESPIVFQRNYAIRGSGFDTDFYPDQFNSYGRVHLMQSLGYFEKIVAMLGYLRGSYSQNGVTVDSVVIRGEMIGNKVQSNYYKIDGRMFYAFDIEIDSISVDAEMFLSLCARFDIPTVPILAKDVLLSEWIGDSDLNTLCEGVSLVNGAVIREGIVIKPMQETKADDGSRLFLKAVSVAWLEAMGKGVKK